LSLRSLSHSERKRGWTYVSIWAVALQVLHGVYQFSATILDSEILLIVYCDFVAHGGYSFCALAGLVILNATDRMDKRTFLRWVTQRQLATEGGFQGRTNKLVDGCYSFWQGGVFPLMDRVFITPQWYTDAQTQSVTPCVFQDYGGWCYDQLALQQYVLGCCQSIHGGLIDKPGRNADYYHTCYCLSGLSVAQHNPHYLPESQKYLLLGNPQNLLRETDPVHNICIDKVIKAREYFSKLSKPVCKAPK